MWSVQAMLCLGFSMSGSPLLATQGRWLGSLAPSPSFPGFSPFQEIVESPACVSGIWFPQIYSLFRVEFFPFFSSQLVGPLVAFLPSPPDWRRAVRPRQRKGRMSGSLLRGTRQLCLLEVSSAKHQLISSVSGAAHRVTAANRAGTGIRGSWTQASSHSTHSAEPSPHSVSI